MEMTCNHLTGERGVTAKIKGAMQEAAKQFVYIGFLLWEVKEYRYHEELGYSSVYEYAEKELGFKKSSTKNFIAICETFSIKNETYFYITPTMHLQEKWTDYNYSQLTEMLAMSPAQRQETKPSMTVRQLREIKKAPIVIDATPPEPKPEPTGQTSGQIHEPTPEEVTKENERLTNLYGIEANIVKINGEQTEVTHYIMEELCRLAGIKYIEFEDYEITIKQVEDDWSMEEPEEHGIE